MIVLVILNNLYNRVLLLNWLSTLLYNTGTEMLATSVLAGTRTPAASVVVGFDGWH